MEESFGFEGRMRRRRKRVEEVVDVGLRAEDGCVVEDGDEGLVPEGGDEERGRGGRRSEGQDKMEDDRVREERGKCPRLRLTASSSKDERFGGLQ